MLLVLARNNKKVTANEASFGIGMAAKPRKAGTWVNTVVLIRPRRHASEGVNRLEEDKNACYKEQAWKGPISFPLRVISIPAALDDTEIGHTLG